MTGLLVPFEPRDDGSREPVDPPAFARALAERVNALLADPARAARHRPGGPRAGGRAVRLAGDRERDGGALRAACSERYRRA